MYLKWGLSVADLKRQEISFCQQILCPQSFLFAFTFLLELWAFVTGGAGGGQGQDFDRPTTSQKIGPFWSGQNRRCSTKQVLNYALSGQNFHLGDNKRFLWSWIRHRPEELGWTPFPPFQVLVSLWKQLKDAQNTTESTELSVSLSSANMNRLRKKWKNERENKSPKINTQTNEEIIRVSVKKMNIWERLWMFELTILSWDYVAEEVKRKVCNTLPPKKVQVLEWFFRKAESRIWLKRLIFIFLSRIPASLR